MIIPPSIVVRARQGSNLSPPLGDVSPEWRHLNLDWVPSADGGWHRQRHQKAPRSPGWPWKPDDSTKL